MFIYVGAIWRRGSAMVRGPERKWRAIAAFGVAVLLSTPVALAVRAPAEAAPPDATSGAASNGGGGGAGAAHHPGRPPLLVPRTRKQVEFHDRMRVLWTDHVVWTRLAIVTFADGSAGFDATATRLLRNQTDIGNAVKPFYGTRAGDRLTALLNEHIAIAVELLQAAKAGDTPAFDAARARWNANADQIADFLSAANPRWWPKATLRAAMRTHLDQTLSEAAHELGGDYTASIADYEAVQEHILAMADLLSSGIMRQFPHRFR
jgi:hypothetical protein